MASTRPANQARLDPRSLPNRVALPRDIDARTLVDECVAADDQLHAAVAMVALVLLGLWGVAYRMLKEARLARPQRLHPLDMEDPGSSSTSESATQTYQLTDEPAHLESRRADNDV